MKLQNLFKQNHYHHHRDNYWIFLLPLSSSSSSCIPLSSNHYHLHLHHYHHQSPPSTRWYHSANKCLIFSQSSSSLLSLSYQTNYLKKNLLIHESQFRILIKRFFSNLNSNSSGSSSSTTTTSSSNNDPKVNSSSPQLPSSSTDFSQKPKSKTTTTIPLHITIKMSISFSNGYFSLRFASNECLFHFWSPIQLVLKMLQEELASNTNASSSSDESDSNKPSSTINKEDNLINLLEIEFDDDNNLDETLINDIRFDHIKFGRIEMIAEHHDDDTSSSSSGTEEEIPNPEESAKTSKIKDDQQSSKKPGDNTSSPISKNRYRLARLMPFGYALLGCDLDQVYFVGTGTGTTILEGPDGYRPYVSRPLRINYRMVDKTKTLKIDIELWHQKNPMDSQTMLFKTKTIDPNLFEQNELVFLQQERQLLLEKFQPLQLEFAQLVQSARKESRRKFKFGGLFLLSAQLGFVGRLTYFEYSWDIMEPVTWIMTYTTMVGSFAYYIVTSEEYVVPMVEKRMIASRFWKLAQSKQFNVQQYKQFKEELKQLDERIAKLRAGF